MTVMLVLPVWPVASRTDAPSVCVPFAALGLFTVNHGMVTGPRDDDVSEAITFPSTLSEKTLDDPLVPSTHMTTQTVPLTVEPALGCVMKTLRGRGAGAAVRSAEGLPPSPCHWPWSPAQPR